MQGGMAQVKLNGDKERIAVLKDGQQVARLEYRRVRHQGKTRRVLCGPIKLLPQPQGKG